MIDVNGKIWEMASRKREEIRYGLCGETPKGLLISENGEKKEWIVAGRIKSKLRRARSSEVKKNIW